MKLSALLTPAPVVQAGSVQVHTPYSSTALTEPQSAPFDQQFHNRWPAHAVSYDDLTMGNHTESTQQTPFLQPHAPAVTPPPRPPQVLTYSALRCGYQTSQQPTAVLSNALVLQPSVVEGKSLAMTPMSACSAHSQGASSAASTCWSQPQQWQSFQGWTQMPFVLMGSSSVCPAPISTATCATAVPEQTPTVLTPPSSSAGQSQSHLTELAGLVANYLQRVMEDCAVHQESLNNDPFYPTFASAAPPQIPLAKYAERIMWNTQVSATTLLVAAVLFQRLSARVPLTAWSGHRLLVAAVVLAIKVHEESYHSISFYAGIAGIVPQEMRAMERTAFQVLDFNCFVAENEYRRVLLSLRRLHLAASSPFHQATPLDLGGDDIPTEVSWDALLPAMV